MKIKTLTIILLALFATIGKSQNKARIDLFTDRNIYVSGETVLAKIYTPTDDASRIVYLDLVSPYGTRITGAPIEIKHNQAEGYLQLPDSLSSGTYLVRSYLKNTAGKLKIIREIWISNRFDKLEEIKQIKRLATSEKNQPTKTNQIQIKDLNTEYRTNNAIEAQIQIDETLQKEIDGNLLISVAQTNSSFDSGSFTWVHDEGKEGMTESKGIIISGMVTDKKTAKPVPDIFVYLTIPDSIPGFQYYKTQTDGRFYFMLDKYFGPVEAFIQCFGNTPQQRLKIKLDELFAEPGDLPEFSEQSLSDEFRKEITQNIEALTFRKIFAQEKINKLAPEKYSSDAYPYYGKADHIADPQLFIDLPDFNEISKELLPGVKFRNYNNEPSLQVINNPMRNYFSDQPLILIDGIPIRDLNRIKDMGTSDIDRIEICRTERYFGDLRFPGVVAIYTTNADYSVIPESDLLIRLKTEAIQNQAVLAQPAIVEPSVPDLRQVIYWNPDIKPEKNISINCTTSSVIGLYKLVVRGRLKDGTLFFTEKHFDVK